MGVGINLKFKVSPKINHMASDSIFRHFLDPTCPISMIWVKLQKNTPHKQVFNK